MALNLNKELKLYYSIKEVAEMFDLNESTLRYWETEFPALRPKTLQGSKIRQYTKKDIELVKSIHNLVKVRGFKLSAAREMLNNNRLGADRTADVITRLQGVRDELQAIRKQLDYLE
jgi:DNA-binding transcriptional MerR regulator